MSKHTLSSSFITFRSGIQHDRLHLQSMGVEKWRIWLVAEVATLRRPAGARLAAMFKRVLMVWRSDGRVESGE